MKYSYKWLFVSLAMLCAVNTFAQNSFRYQAVARDSAGNAIANQLIGVQISIILDDVNNSAIYEESHQPTSNAYGVLNLNVGEGTVLFGDFATINWSQTAFIKVELDLTGGTNYTIESISEILSVPRALYAERAGSVTNGNFGLNVKDFGAIGDGSVDDFDAFEMALDSAALTGATVLVPAGVYKLSETLLIKDGVSMIGEGMGSEPLQTPFNGSLLMYEGEDFAVKIIGHTASVRNLVLRDISGGTATGGLYIEADGRLLENATAENILISNFTGGTGFKLYPKNAGGIAYANFNNIRIRNAKIGIHINDDGNGSFVNSNSFANCQISGGGFDYGLLIDAGNNNTFYSTVIEPPSTNFGHLFINKGEIFGEQIRIEGNSQAATTPLIYMASDTKNTTLTGVYAGGLTIDKGNNFINMTSGKAIHFRNANFNRFRNAAFNSADNLTVNDWEITGSGVSTSILVAELIPEHQVIKITIPSGTIANLEPTAAARPKIGDLALFKQVNFGFYVRTNQAGKVYTATNAPLGWTASTAHSGSDEWEFVGMNAQVNQSAQPIFRLQINNNSGSTMEVYVTTPTLSFGNQVPTLEAAPLTTNGGILNGQITNAMTTIAVPTNGFLSLPLNANYYEITNSNTIARINHTAIDRVPKGTVVTLLFNNGSTNVTNSAYLNLKSGFTSVANGSLTLISNGNGTWREVNRNN